MKILLVEDEPELRKSIKHFLIELGYIVESANDFESASQKINDYSYDCVLLDIGLPKGNGLDLIPQIQQLKKESGMIIISAKNSEQDKIEGLNLGADDYLSKPFSLPELNARIRALLRRRQNKGDKTIQINEIEIFPDNRLVKVKDAEVQLTTKEFDLLEFFSVNRNRVLSKINIAEHLWGDNADKFDNHDFIYVHLKNLRKKLTDAGANDYIETIYGIGYKLNCKK
ncbi:MAG: response regulator transcription factor [Bacteroidetes bacterium]|nr:response regulator transcription factor [Bacteroidota bacterium]